MSGDVQTQSNFSTEKVEQTQEREIDNTGGAGHSTGPRTAAGKRRSSQNAIKHGFYSREKIKHHIRPEDRREYRKILAALIEEKGPVGESEYFQVELMAEARHDLKRIERLRTSKQPTRLGACVGNAFDVEDDPKRVGWRCDMPPVETLAKIQQFKSEVLKHYYRADHELERLQKMRKLRESNNRAD